MHTQKIVPHLWYDKEAEDAVMFYMDIFNNNPKKRVDSKILDKAYYAQAGHDIHKQEAGSLMSVSFELEGQKYMAINGGPVFTFNESISFMVYCDTQEEIDYFWERLSFVPEAEQCGWLKDKYGLSWQIVPTIMDEMMSSDETKKIERVTNAFMQMKKLEIQSLKQAFEGN